MLGEPPCRSLPSWGDAERGPCPSLPGCPEPDPRSPWSCLGMALQMVAGNGVTLCPNPTPCWERANTLYGLRSPSPSKKETSSPGVGTPARTFKHGLFTQRWMSGTGVQQWMRPGGARSAAHKADAGGRGTEVGAVLAPAVLEAPQQSCGPVEAELSPTSHSGTADSYTAPKASGEAGLARAPRHGPSQIASPLPRAKGQRQASRHQQA